MSCPSKDEVGMSKNHAHLNFGFLFGLINGFIDDKLVHGAVQQKNSYIGTGMAKHPGANRGRTASEGPSGDGTTISHRQGFLAWP